jgi:UDP-GlcNAc:undecaprenyl-phosphate GlcNAc-1-phosphate transferase
MFSLLINAIFLRFVKTMGIREYEGEIIRWSSETKPSLGGISLYIAFLISVACYSIFFHQENVFHNSTALGLMASTGLAFLMGLADDAYNTRPFLKFFVQVMCGVVLIASNNYITIFENDIANYTLTIFWVVGIMNSINMLDNMDAITAVVSCFIVGTVLMYLIVQGQSTDFDFIILLGVFAALIGFLFYNWNPSKMFMGDTGSQFLGIFLAAIGIKYLWNLQGLDGSEVAPKQFASVLLAFLLPLTDTTVVVINRLGKKQSPFVGGKDHTTHHLSYLGLSDSQVAFIFIGLSSLSLALSYIVFKFIDHWQTLHTIAFGTYFSVIFFLMLYITKMKKQPKKKIENG